MVKKFLQSTILALLCLALICLSSSAMAQKGRKRISVHFRNDLFEYVVETIKSKTQLSFLAITQETEQAKPVTLDCTMCTVDKVLELLSRDQPFNIRRFDKYIQVIAKTPYDTITLLILDEDLQPLPLASVKVGPETLMPDRTARVRIPRFQKGTAITVSHIGFHESGFQLNNDTLILMKRKMNKLQEVHRIGYLSANRKFFSGNVVRVPTQSKGFSKDLTDVLEQGVPGLRMVQFSGVPLGKEIPEIRGSQTISPLGSTRIFDAATVTVNDLVFYQDFMKLSRLISITGDPSRIGHGINPLQTFSEANIKEVSVYKDGLSTAQFGARASNGVIAISTPLPSPYLLDVQAKLSTGISKAISVPRLLSGGGYYGMRKTAYDNDHLRVPDYADIKNLDTSVNSDWAKWMYDNPAVNHAASVSVSSTSNGFGVYLSGDYRFREYPLPVKSTDRWGTADMTFRYQPGNARKWDIQTVILYVNGKINAPMQDPYNAIFLSPLISSLKDESGKLKWSERGVGFTNPLGLMENTYQSNLSQWIISTKVKYQLSDRTKLSLMAGGIRQVVEETNLMPSTAGPAADSLKGSFEVAFSRESSLAAEVKIDQDFSIGKNIEGRFFGALSVQRHYSRFDERDSAEINNDNSLMRIARSVNPDKEKNRALYEFNSAVAGLSIAFPKHLSMDLVARSDASTRLSPNKRWGFFGAAGLAWRFTDLDFMKEIKWLTFGKLTMSYGSTGADYLNFQTDLNASNPDSLRRLKWAITRKLDLAMDLGIGRDLDIKIGYYRNVTRRPYVITSVLKDGEMLGNVINSSAVIANTGWEGQVSYDKQVSDKFGIRLNISLTLPRNVLLNSGDGEPFKADQKGHPLSARKVYQYEGVRDGKYVVRNVGADSISLDDDGIMWRDLEVKAFGNINLTLKLCRFAVTINMEMRKQPGFSPEFYLFDRLLPGNESKRNLFSNQPAGYGSLPALTTYTADKRKDYTHLVNSTEVFRDASWFLLRKVQIDYVVPAFRLGFLDEVGITGFVQAENPLLITSYPSIGNPMLQQPVGMPVLQSFSIGAKINITRSHHNKI